MGGIISWALFLVGVLPIIACMLLIRIRSHTYGVYLINSYIYAFVAFEVVWFVVWVIGLMFIKHGLMYDLAGILPAGMLLYSIGPYVVGGLQNFINMRKQGIQIQQNVKPVVMNWQRELPNGYGIKDFQAVAGYTEKDIYRIVIWIYNTESFKEPETVDWSALANKLRQELGFPATIEIRSSGELLFPIRCSHN